MDTIIARQSVARRRQPYSPVSGHGEKKNGLFGHSSGILKKGKSARKDPAPLWFEAARPDTGKGPVPIGQRPAKRLPAAHRPHGRSRAVLARIGRAPVVLSGLLRKAFSSVFAAFLGTPAAASSATAVPPSQAKASGRAGRILGRAAMGLGLAFLALALVFVAISIARPRFPLPQGELLPQAAAARQAVAPALAGSEAEPSLPSGGTPGSPVATDAVANPTAALSEGEALLLDYISPEYATSLDPASIANLPLPQAVEISYYTVKRGDAISTIARRFGRSADSILSLNGIKNAKSLKIGTELKIPNMDGLLHVVAKGESLGSIARRYKVELTLLADANDLGSMTLKVGQSLFIPGARLSADELRRIYGSTFAWPVRGPISSWFGVRGDPFTGVRRFHAGIDIVVNLGTPVKASADGVVADAGYNANYGNYIILTHGDGYQTLYGHLSAFSIKRGQSVSQGQVIGKSGSSGYSTGPHLHFGVYKKGVAVDPLKAFK